MKKAKVGKRLSLYDLIYMRKEWDEKLKSQRFITRLQVKVIF